MTQFLVGADPEVFVKDASGRNVSGHGMVPGTKKKPHAVMNGAVQVDGTALEFNIVPAKNKAEFRHNIQAVLDQLKAMIPPGHSLDMEAVVRYEEAYFEKLPIYAKKLGCAPDYDAYTGHEMCRPDAEQTMRTAAGHLHLGWTEGMKPFNGRHFQSCRSIVKELDASLGLASVLFDQKGQERRLLYGQAGAFRPKTYGCEYRVLSNVWLRDPELTDYVYDMTRAAYDRMSGGGMWCFKRIRHDTCQEIINTGDKDKAEKYMLQMGLNMPPGYKSKAKKKDKQPSVDMYDAVAVEDILAKFEEMAEP